MDNSRANIDLLFRNGLKDLEVLPPVGAWANIRPVIRKKAGPFVFLRSAAMIAVLISLSIIVYRYNRELQVSAENLQPVMNELTEQMLPGNASTPVLASRENRRRETVPQREQAVINETVQLAKYIVNPDETAYPPATNNFSYSELISPPGPVSALYRTNIIRYPEVNEVMVTDSYYDDRKERTPRWSLSALASPIYYNGFAAPGDELSQQLMASEQTRVSYSGGVSFAYKLSKKLSIQSGIYYASVGQEVAGISSYAGFQRYDYTKGDANFRLLTSSGTIYTNNSDVFLVDRSADRILTAYTNDVFDPVKSELNYLNNSLRQSYSYIEMPVIIRYKLLNSIIDFNLIGGLSYNLLVNNAVYTTSDAGRFAVGKTEGLNPFTISSSFGMGMEYNFSDKISFNLEPTFRYYLNPFTAVPGLRTHPYSFGIFSGLSYRF
jgi:hypothetical protein